MTAAISLNPTSALKQARELVENADFDAALKLLDSSTLSTMDKRQVAQAQDLRGNALHFLERYGEAKDAFEASIAAGNKDPNCAKKLDYARAADTGNTAGPGFTMQRMAQEIATGEFPARPARPEQLAPLPDKRPWLRQAYEGAMSAIGGFVGQTLIRPLTNAMIRNTAKKATPESYTDWEYRYEGVTERVKGLTRWLGDERSDRIAQNVTVWATLFEEVGPHRENLLNKNRKPMDLPGTVPNSRAYPPLEGKTPLAPTPGGHWSDPERPDDGAAGMPGIRATTVTDTSADWTYEELAEIAHAFLEPKEGQERIEATWLNNTFPYMIQRNVHVFKEGYKTAEKIMVELSENSEARKLYGVKRLAIDSIAGEMEPGYFRSGIPHRWSPTDLIGSTPEEQARVRSFQDGKLKTDGRCLPLDPETGKPMLGFDSNMSLGLELIETTLVHEWNNVADDIVREYPELKGKDQEIFDRVFPRVKALGAKIHTLCWTQALLASPTFTSGMGSNWNGILTEMFRGPDSRRTVTPFNLGDSITGGLVGNKRLSDLAYGLGPVFEMAYRPLHDSLRDTITIRDLDGKVLEEVSLRETMDANGSKLMRKYGPEVIAHSLLTESPFAVAPNNGPEAFKALPRPGHPAMSMGLMDLRAEVQEKVPPYNTVREELHLRKHTCLEDWTDDAVQLRKAYKAYGKFDNPIDHVHFGVGVRVEGLPRLPDFNDPAVLKEYQDLYNDKELFGEKARLLSKEELEEKFPKMVDVPDMKRSLVQRILGKRTERRRIVPRPKSHALNETLLAVFELFASIRIWQDPDLTTYYNKETLGHDGMKYIDEMTWGRLLERVYPKLEGKVTANGRNAFHRIDKTDIEDRPTARVYPGN